MRPVLLLLFALAPSLLLAATVDVMESGRTVSFEVPMPGSSVRFWTLRLDLERLAQERVDWEIAQRYLDEVLDGGRRIGVHYGLRVAGRLLEFSVLYVYYEDGHLEWDLDPAAPGPLVRYSGRERLSKKSGGLLWTRSVQVEVREGLPKVVEMLLADTTPRHEEAFLRGRLRPPDPSPQDAHTQKLR